MGKVSEIRGWGSESGRSVARVTWASGSTNVYRMGYKGKVDLKFMHAASGGPYYRDHLQVLGQCSVLCRLCCFIYRNFMLLYRVSLLRMLSFIRWS